MLRITQVLHANTLSLMSMKLTLAGLLSLGTIQVVYAQDTTAQAFDRWSLVHASDNSNWAVQGVTTTDHHYPRLFLEFDPSPSCHTPSITFATHLHEVPIRFAPGPYPGIVRVQIDGTAPWQLQPGESTVTHELSPHQSTQKYDSTYLIHFQIQRPEFLEQLRQSRHSIRIAVPESGVFEDIDPHGLRDAIAAALARCGQR